MLPELYLLRPDPDQPAFQSAPALGGECYLLLMMMLDVASGVSIGTRPWGRMLLSLYAVLSANTGLGFNRHPPLGANATV